MAVLGLKPRWPPHKLMLYDGFMKFFLKSDLMTLLEDMETGWYRIVSELDEMQDRQHIADRGQTVQRLKGATTRKNYQEPGVDDEDENRDVAPVNLFVEAGNRISPRAKAPYYYRRHRPVPHPPRPDGDFPGYQAKDWDKDRTEMNLLKVKLIHACADLSESRAAS